MFELILASTSPRRLQLLELIGFRNVRVVDPDVIEICAADESPQEYSRRIALAKAEAGWAAVGRAKGQRVIGADTEVVLDGSVLGKPADGADARRMLNALSAREHLVLTSVAIVGDGFRTVLSQTSKVEFGVLEDADIERYIGSGEAFGKAGAYAIQGRASAFIRRLEGSHSGVMGLPLFETSRLLVQAGITLP
jgi:septum formation protein